MLLSEAEGKRVGKDGEVFYTVLEVVDRENQTLVLDVQYPDGGIGRRQVLDQEVDEMPKRRYPDRYYDEDGVFDARAWAHDHDEIEEEMD